tara:strand:- start:6728 stop:7969 length:1242 start_codon:yes stop_codon:yes gene_type:complete
MGLWGNSNTVESRPKFLPIDSNAAGSSGARENIIATDGGWGLSPGLAASGNDNADAQPEVLVCIRNLGKFRGSATVQSIDWTQGQIADTGTFDITVTFDEAVDVTSATRTANQTITNKAYILLSRLGQTDMVEDSTMACQYFSGSGTNQITFRGVAQTNAAAGYLAFNGAGVGDAVTPGEAAIVFDGSAAMNEEDGNSSLSIMQESGTGGNSSDRIVLDSTAAVSATTNGALTESTALVLDGNSGTIAVGMKVYALVGATSIADAQGSTECSQDGTLTVTATNGSTSVTLNKAITVANNVDLNFSADGHDEILSDSLDFTVQGVDGATNIMTGVTFTGGDADVKIGLLEEGTAQDLNIGDGGTIVLEGTDPSKTDENDAIVAEDKTSDVAVYTEQGSSSGSAQILMGVTVAAA